MGNELKIQNITTAWNDINKIESPTQIILDNISDFDCAGMQLIIHLYNISRKNPEKYIIVNSSVELTYKLKSFGYIIKEKNEEIK